MTEPDPKRRSILERLNLESPASPGEKSGKRLNGGDVTPETEAKRGGKIYGSSDPDVIPNEPGKHETENEAKWDRARRHFIESDQSLRACADEHGLPYATAKRRARSERWREARKSFREKLDEQIEKAALVSRAEAYQIQERAARETIGIFARVFEERARALHADPASKSAAEDLGKLIQLQLDVCELGLTILGDTEIDWRAARLSARQAAPRIH